MASELPAKPADPNTPATMATVAEASKIRRPRTVIRFASSGVAQNIKMTRHTLASHDASEKRFVPSMPGKSSSVFHEQ